MRRIRAVMAALMVTALVAMPAQAQEGGLRLSTPYLGVAVEPGETASFSFDVHAPNGTPVDLEVTRAPQGWNTTIQGGGFVVSRVLVDEDTDHRMQLQVEVPRDAGMGTYDVTLRAS